MKYIITILLFMLVIILFSRCSGKKSGNYSAQKDERYQVQRTQPFGGYDSQIKWGEHLVIVGLCNDCHTPKKATRTGLVLDTALWLSGHQAGMPKINADINLMKSEGLILRNIFTREWVGPWGVSYAANITPDDTGIGNWTEEQFFIAMREGKYKGLKTARNLLPPMPWEMYKHFTDDEIRAIFAYLKSIKPVHNLVPPSIPAASAVK